MQEKFFLSSKDIVFSESYTTYHHLRKNKTKHGIIITFKIEVLEVKITF